MAIDFVKLHGCGNSFVVVSDLKGSKYDWSELSARICSPQWGIGSDGLMVLKPSMRSQYGIAMYNPDGSVMKMCGNGVRCVVRFMFLQGLLLKSDRSVDFEVEGRFVSANIQQEGRLSKVDMGAPSFEPKSVPIKSPEPFIGKQVEIEGLELNITALSMGNPHCVVFVDSLSAVDVERLGPALENHELFPDRTNVEFVERLDDQSLKVRMWERGAGLTLACGTGTCAAVVAGVRAKLCYHKTRVLVDGGELEVEWDEGNQKVFLTGPANEICSGTISGEWNGLEGR